MLEGAGKINPSHLKVRPPDESELDVFRNLLKISHRLQFRRNDFKRLFGFALVRYKQTQLVRVAKVAINELQKRIITLRSLVRVT